MFGDTDVARSRLDTLLATQNPWACGSPPPASASTGRVEARRCQQDRQRRRLAARRACDGVDPMRVATRTISASPTARPPASSTSSRSAPRPASSSKSPVLQVSRPACCRPTSTRRWQPEHPLVQPSRSPRARPGPDQRRRARVRHAERPQAQRRDRPPARPLFEFFGLRTVYDRYLLRHPPDPRGHRDPAVLLPARRLRAGDQPRRSDRVLRPDVVAGLPAVARRPCSTPAPSAPPDVELLPARLARGRPRGHLQALHRHRQASRSSPAASAWPGTASAPRAASSGHQRPLQRHRAVAQDPRQLGRRGQPGRPPQGRGLRLPRELARRHRGVPRAARQHRRRRPAHPQPQPGQLGARPVHARVEKDWQWSLFDPKTVPAPHRPVRPRVRARLRAAEAEGLFERQVRPASSTRA
jgi:hypothetical protein